MRKILILILIAPLVFLCSCSSSEKTKGTNFKQSSYGKFVRVFFTKSSEEKKLALVNVKRPVEKDSAPLEVAIKELLLGPTGEESEEGIRTEIPVGTRLIKVEESNDDILVDLSNQFLTGGGSASVQLRYIQLFKTLEVLAPGKKVYLHIEGSEPKTIGGEGLEVIQPLRKIEDYTKDFSKSKDLKP